MVAQTVRALNERGIGRGDRVGIVLPNGPEMATAFIAIGGRKMLSGNCANPSAWPLTPIVRST